LHMMVPTGIFFAILAMACVAVAVGLFLPKYCTRQRHLPVIPTSNIFLSSVLSISVCSSYIVFDRAVIDQVPSDNMLTDQLVRTLIAVCGISMALSLVFFLVHYSCVQEASEIWRTSRKLRRILTKPPKARLTLCDDLAVDAPGECAICLEELANLSPELACAPVNLQKVLPTHGLLRFQCGHTFHSCCADRWMMQEVSCPMCRQPIGSLTQCQRICLRHDATITDGKPMPEEGKEGAGGPGEGPADLEEGGTRQNEVKGSLLGVALEVMEEGGQPAQEPAWHTRTVVKEAL